MSGAVGSWIGIAAMLVALGACSAPEGAASRADRAPMVELMSLDARAGVHSVQQRGGRFQVEYYPGRISETEIVRRLQSHCKRTGAVARRSPDDTRHRGDRAKDGTPILLSTFWVDCIIES